MTTIKIDGLFYIMVLGMIFINKDRKVAYDMAINFLHTELESDNGC